MSKKQVLGKLFNLTFLLLLLTPFLGSIFGISSKWDNTERRVLAKFPKFSLNNKSNWAGLLDQYFNDNFGFRSLLIQNYQNFEVNILSNKFLGRSIYNQGWVFEAGGTVGYLKDYYQKALFTKSELLELKTTLEKEQEMLLKKNIPYIVLIVPKKQEIYKELFPYPDEKVFSLRLNQTTLFLKNNTDVNFIDLRKPLLMAKQNNLPLYYRTDTHLTNYGTLVVYQALAEFYSKKNNNFKPLLTDDFEINTEEYPVWNGDDAPKFPNSPTHPDYGANVVLKNGALDNKNKLRSVLIYGDSYIHIKRGIPKEVFYGLFPELKNSQSIFFKEAKYRDTANDMLLPIYNVEEMLPVIERSIADKKTKDRFKNFIINSSIKSDDLEGLARYLLLNFDQVILEDKNKPLTPDEIDKYHPDLVIRETEQASLQMLFFRDDSYQKETIILSK